MPSEFSWIIPNHVLLQRQYGHITHEDYLAGVGEANRWLDSSPEAEVHLLSDNLEVTQTEVSIKDLQQTLAHMHPRLGFTLTVYPNNPQIIPLVNLLTSFLGFFSPLKLKLFTTKAEALAFLGEQRPQLATLLETQKGEN